MTFNEISEYLKSEPQINWINAVKYILKETGNENLFIDIISSNSSNTRIPIGYVKSFRKPWITTHVYTYASAIALYNGELFLLADLYEQEEWRYAALTAFGKAFEWEKGKCLSKKGVGLSQSAAKEICRFLVNNKDNLCKLCELPSWKRIDDESELGYFVIDICLMSPTYSPKGKEDIMNILNSKLKGYIYIN